MKMRSGEGLRNVDQIFEMRGRESFLYMSSFGEGSRQFRSEPL
jgi:hypothetical protein